MGEYLQRFLVAMLWLLFVSAGSSAAFADSVVVLYKESYQPYIEAISGFKRTLVKGEFDVIYHDITSNEALPVSAGSCSYAVALGTDAVKYARSNVPAVPIVFSMVLNPQQSKIIVSCDNPGDDITGVMLNIDPVKKFSLLKEMLPDFRVIGFVYDGNNYSQQVDYIQNAASVNGFEFVSEAIDNSSQINNAITDVLKRSDCLWSRVDPLIYNRNTVREILVMSLKSKKPMVAFSSAYVKAGALLAFECDYEDIGRQTAELLMKMRHQGSRGGVPVEPPAKIVIAVNKRTMNMLGINIPGKFLESAVLYGE